MSGILSVVCVEDVAGYVKENDREDTDKRTKAVGTQRHMSRECGFSYLVVP